MMRHRWIILIIGLLLGIGGYCAFYFCATAKHRRMAQEKDSDLLWLKMEFRLSDADFKRISDLHNAYLPKCKEMCQRIATRNAELKTIVAQTNTVTLEMKKKLAEIAEVRSECQTTMLQHFYEVSHAMPSEQGKRYLEWIQSKTLGFDRSSAREMGHDMQ